MKKPAQNLIKLQDEILQILYWLRGEHLCQKVSLEDLNRFLGQDPVQLEWALKRLRGKNLIAFEAVDSPPATGGSPNAPPANEGTRELEEVRLTEGGIEEGRRRFEDEFEGRLGHASHLVCDDPNCDCHDPEGDGYCHAAAAH